MVNFVDDSDEAFMRESIQVSLTRGEWAAVAHALTVQLGSSHAEAPKTIGLALVAISGACAEGNSPASHAGGDLAKLVKLAYGIQE